MSHRWIAGLLCMLAFVGLVQAQDVPPMPTPNDDLTISPINFDQIVADTVTDKAVYDWWQITLNSDDVIVVEMQAFQGLAPLIGILSPTHELVARSDDSRAPDPDSLAVIQYRATTSGLYTIAATRQGNQAGTTTGAYQLKIRKINDVPARENTLAPVEFRCDKKVATNVLMLAFQDEIPSVLPADAPYREQYRLTIYGEGAFAPLILADADLVKTGRLDCTSDASALLGNTYTFPGEAAVTISEAEQTHAAQMTLRNTSMTDAFGQLRFTIGSLNAGAGRYMAVLEGLALQEGGDVDTLLIRPGPLAAKTPITVYVVGDGRLDVSLEVYDKNNALVAQCDDAGRDACANVKPFVGDGGTFVDGEMPTIGGDRFDAGVQLPLGVTDPLQVQISGGGTGTQGRYTVFIIGGLPQNK